MVYVSFIACLVATLVVLQSMIATSDFLAPLLSPIFDDACKKVECGKGTCKASSNSSFFYECECDPGWKQTRSDHDDTLKFLPCVVPNCTMDYSCVAAPSPIQDKSSKSNASVFDPCFWTDCGGGSCNKTSPFTYSCECTEGYYNLLNISAFPCFKECAIGMDCSNLGISMSNRSASPTPVLTESSNQEEMDLRVALYSYSTFTSDLACYYLLCDTSFSMDKFNYMNKIGMHITITGYGGA
ncbi:conserved hypothetical protein [Ricinus communis]|uniref:EGF-like domain-containing protein n=1 Tax=Ricinus communis TaxID=3988 RepID=B9RTK8_RICCO|nr:conserved hypothetical protein [Ricinus communis]